MVDRHDYVALEWVKGEIAETLKQARSALDAYVETLDDDALNQCLAGIHQVHGALQMVEFYGAALLAEEIEELAAHWQSGDLAAIDTMMRTCNCMDDIDMKAALLDTRNQRMAERIPALLDANPQLFIAVGLLHMVGENNLVDLLRQQGFTVRQLTGKGAAPASAP